MVKKNRNFPKHIKGNMYNWKSAKKKNSPASKYKSMKKAWFSIKYKRKFDSYGQFAQLNREQYNRIKKLKNKEAYEKYNSYNGNEYVWKYKRS